MIIGEGAVFECFLFFCLLLELLFLDNFVLLRVQTNYIDKMQTKLENKSVIITGATGGIGSATAKLFVEEGANVLLVDIEEKTLQILAHSLGEQVHYCVADVSLEEHTKQYIQKAIDLFGSVEVLFLNAGIAGAPTSLWEITEEKFDQMMNINVKGVWLGMKHILPQMMKQGKGSIIATSSVAGIKGQVRGSSYVASKHAVVGLVKSAALEVGKMGIRVNSINPGPIETNMVRDLEDSISKTDREKARKILENNIPMKRYGLPEEVAKLVLFLASDESSFINGGVHTIDGGIAC